MFLTASSLAKRIPGMRKGSDTPAYHHSFDVAERLKTAGYDEEVCIAGLLHDVIEDSDTKIEELAQLGFPPRVITLVQLCTHNAVIAHGDPRWVCMMADLVKAQNPEAWAIKIADISSNLTDSTGMSPDRRHFMRTVKAPLILSLTEGTMSNTSLWRLLHGLAQKIV
jgi:(p)ppGpp synthase/HD superfamily hydrolase